MRTFKLLYALALATVTAATLNACSADRTARNSDSYAASTPVTLSGSFLAGRFAQHEQDWGSAQNYMASVLKYDGNNALLTQRTFLLALGSGNDATAHDLALKIIADKSDDELALIYLSSEAISHDDFAGALADLQKLPDEGFGQYTKPLLTAWALMGEGKKDEALKMLAANSAPDDPTYHMHAGMMEEMSNNMNAAADHYKAAMEGGLSLHTALIVGNFFQRYGQPEIAKSIYQGLANAYPFNPFIAALDNDKQRVVAPNITRAADGAALAIFDLASLLYEKRAYDSAQIYGGIVQLLQPQFPYAKLMMGDLAALHGQYSKAAGIYNSAERGSPVYWLARMRMADVDEANGHVGDAVKIIGDLSQSPQTRRQSFVALGDIYRRHEQYGDAVKAYDQALSGIDTYTADLWPVIYARGMSYERLNNWTLAEKDLLKALEFQPDNPMILNFIGYSWANQGVHLAKALEYTKRAVAQRPTDGYMLDSYGWTLFRMAKYKDSITWLEQALQQYPDDSTILDHLGDAYWQVGRKTEARFQWHRAGDVSQDAGFKLTLQQKIQHGITVPSQVAAGK